MSIRKTLLVAFVFVGLVSAILMAWLAFVKAREAVQQQIERSIAAEAATVGADIDKMMFERLQNAAIWSRLDIMQDLQVHDVDKRVSRFLADLKEGYRNVYVNLSCKDAQGRIVASSDPALIGTTPAGPAPWLTTSLSGSRLDLDFGGSAPQPGVAIETAIPAAFSAQPLGRLRLQLDWTEITNLLDRESLDGGRLVAVLDRDGRLIAGSARLRTPEFLLGRTLADWRGAGDAVVSRSGAPILDSRVVVGAAASRGYPPFEGFGWTTLIIQPLELAFEPIHRMAVIFVVLLGTIVGFTLLAALWVSEVLARPIVALTGLARAYMRDRVLVAPPAVPGRGEIGELSEAFVQMVRDIDQSQRSLVRASKLAVVGEMASAIAHEVRTPLGILRSSAQMLHREPQISAEGRELIGFVESETDRLNRLVSSMLDLARPRSPARAQTDLHALIAHAIALLAAQAESKQIATHAHPLARDPVVACDEEQMTQVVLNILLNGLQILHRGGRIDVTTRDAGDQLEIEIADDGPGIDPAERARVFEAFFFRREGGIGLGLAVVQQIVSAHGGEIEADESALGGALFRIRLPRRQSEKS